MAVDRTHLRCAAGGRRTAVPGLVSSALAIVAWLLVFDTGASAAKARTDKCLLNWTPRAGEDEPVASAGADSLAASKRVCGHGTSFLHTYGSARNLIPVPTGGKTLYLMPLALYPKDLDDDYCDNIKIRNACYRWSADRRSLTLSDPAVPADGEATFTVAENGVTGLYQKFALIQIDPKRITERVEAFQKSTKSCQANPRSRKCRSGVEAAAENFALERLRQQRFPSIGDWPGERKDLESALGPLSPTPSIIHQMMMANELGPNKSPYALTDAGVEYSGVSYGVRQLDIGGGAENKPEPGAREIFLRNLGDFARRPEWRRLSTRHRQFVTAPTFQQPVRKFTPLQLLMLHQAAPILNDAMRTPAAKQRYNAHHKKFLADETRHYAELRQRCLFKDSRYLTLAAIDRRNQNKKIFYPRILQKVSEDCRKSVPVSAAECDVHALFTIYQYRSDAIRDLLGEPRLGQCTIDFVDPRRPRHN